jgi:hypothetical protein
MKSTLAPSRVSFLTLVGYVYLVALASLAHAAPLTSWTSSVGTGGSQLNTNSPVLVLTNGAQAIYAVSSTSYNLAVGDSIKLSGGVTFTGMNTTNTADQFRFGLYDSNGQTGTNGWLGYFASNAGPSGGDTSSRLWERVNPNAANFYQNGANQATMAAFVNASPSNTAFASGTYTFSLTYTRTASGMSIAWNLIGTDINYSLSRTFNDTTPQTFTFDRIGLATLGLGSSTQANFSDLDLTYTPVPEPAVASLLFAGLLVFALRRRRSPQAWQPPASPS